MKAAFVYFPAFTLLDVVGVYDPLLRLQKLGYLPDLEIDHRAFHPHCGEVSGWLPPSALFPADEGETASLSGYDLVFVPGGLGTRPLLGHTTFLAWLATAAACPLLVSVCTGSLLLGAAGLLRGHRATTHFGEYERLRPFVRQLEEAQLLDDGKVITAGAVAASLPLGLYLCERLAGKAAREAVAKQMNWPWPQQEG